MALPLCIVGAGSIGMRHIGCAQASGAVELTAIVDPVSRCGLDLVATLDAVPQHTRAAIIATPTGDHFDTAMACLDRGWAVLVEKPLTATTDQARALCARAAALGLPLLTGHHRRCHPFVAQARKQITGLGALVAVQGIWSLRKHDTYFEAPWRRAPGAGVILTNLSHEVDLLRLLVGEITSVTAQTSNVARGLGVEDTAAITFGFANGALGTFIVSDVGTSPWAFEAATQENPAIAVQGPDPLRIIGTHGALGFPSLQVWHGTDWTAPLQCTPAADLKQVDAIAAQMDRFAAVVRGGIDPELATGHDGLRTMQVIDAIAAAAASGQTHRIGE
jgi:predicted dehydrogenase